MTFNKLEKIYIGFLIVAPIIVAIKSSYMFITLIACIICSLSFVLLITLKILDCLLKINSNISLILENLTAKNRKVKDLTEEVLDLDTMDFLKKHNLLNQLSQPNN